MLDDLKYIHQRDAQDALGIAEKQWQQYVHDYGFSWQPEREIHNIIVAGMGGSGLAAKTAKTWPGLAVPYEVVQDYTLPKYISQNTLLICSSYSGNTEETIFCLEEATKADAVSESSPMVVVVAAGGKLIQIAKEKNLPFIELPSGFQPRMTFGYQLRALCEILEQARMCSGVIAELHEAGEWLKDKITAWIPTVAVKDNAAKSLALDCIGKSPVIYAGSLLETAAYKWKISFNENAKNVAWYNVYPEFNHNEFLGWTSHPVDKPYKVIDLRSSYDHARIQKRFELSDKLLSGRRPAAVSIQAEGDTILKQLMWTIALGDFVSLYTALLNGLNPTPVDLIEKFKKALDD